MDNDVRSRFKKQTNNPQTTTTTIAAATTKTHSYSSNNFSLHFHLQALFTLFNACLQQI